MYYVGFVRFDPRHLVELLPFWFLIILELFFLRMAGPKRCQHCRSSGPRSCQTPSQLSTMNVGKTNSYVSLPMRSPESDRQPLESELPEKVRLGIKLFRVAEAAARPIDALFEQVSEGGSVSSSELWQLAKHVRSTVFHQGCEAAGLTEGEVDAALQQS